MKLAVTTSLLVAMMYSNVLAAETTKNVQIQYNNIKLVVDGVPITPKDTNGSNIEPFIYNGTTYLPIRAVGEAIGKQVTWDGVTKTVYLGETPNKGQYLVDVCPPYEKSQRTYIHTYSSPFYMGGTQYISGITMNIMEKGSWFLCNLNSEYQELKFYLGHVDKSGMSDVKLSIFCDEVLYFTYDISAADLPQLVTIPVNDVNQLKVVATYDEYEGYPTIGLGNMIIK